ncbi:beta-ketoacyl-ACP synthase III [Sediminitomix flava]|uniref:Beta-ketoacyl-[acyl-carrier-protein] synthase III n=1 Tax=Sediminitomix flava TaxID=379075 RepID=A0A315Z691_SEDFL|nr:beta-ketoacyl-ACP synthase III [Sediminitomix flava]PWJ38606.1 3-oxoacyl-[acyl-carrier-protein] synthase III [Sediminitomix flava]
MTKLRAAITGVGKFLPDYILDNKELEELVDTNDAWIMERTGIKERRILKGEKGTSYMGVRAVKDVLEKTNTSPEEIDLIICATVTPDMLFPATANIIAGQVGAVNAFSYDVLAACSGFVYALSTASQFIETGKYKKVVVVGADKMSSIVDYTDRTTCVLFGDGAGAVLLEATTEEEGIMDFVLKTDGVNGPDALKMPAGGSLKPASVETVMAKEHFAKQDGRTVFKYAVTAMADVAAEIMDRNKLSSDDVAYLVPHQANKRIIDATARRMGVGEEKVMMNIERYGNTTAATIPLCLNDYENKLNKGDNIVLAAFGGGFTWGSVYVKWAY